MARIRRAVVIGATGLVGKQMVRGLLEKPEVERVVTLVRRPSGQAEPKLEEHVVDFDEPESYRGFVEGDALFSALGTTIRKAGSREAQFRVDHDYQLEVARAAREAGVGTFVLVSALGASPRSLVFYSRMKGQLEERVRELQFERTRILRPGILDGERAERRPGEERGLQLARLLPRWEVLAALRPIDVSVVARAGIRAAEDDRPGEWRLDAAELFRVGA